MIKTPEVKRRFVPKTQQGVKLRGAMIWVVLGLLAGVVAAVVTFAVTLLIAEGIGGLIDHVHKVCPSPPWWIRVIVALVALEFFALTAKGLWMLRGPIAQYVKPRYGEFAGDVADWFRLGAIFAFVIAGIPLFLLLVLGMSC